MSLFEDNDEQRLFRQEFRKFCAREITPNVESWERDRAVPGELWKRMGDQGCLCPWLPEAYGGLDLDFSCSIIICEELIRADGFGVGVPLHADVAVLAVRIEPSDFGPGGISLIVVENGTPGFSRGRKLEKMGYRISRLFRDARSLSIFAGTTEIMKLIIARRYPPESEY
jgi:alkylation response protein AidB-like acyl-CoA dehydrogenase